MRGGFKLFLLGLGASAMLAVSGCAFPAAAKTDTASNAINNSGIVTSGGAVAPMTQGSGSVASAPAIAAPEAARADMSYAPGYAPYYQPSFQASGGSAEGIWVTGAGNVTLKPDLAVISAGVEATALTVNEARQKAAAAMQKVMDALKKSGIEEKDIQTTYYNIYPQYTYRQITKCDPVQPMPEPRDGAAYYPEKGCYQQGEQVLTGYMVNNQVTVKIRNLDNAGAAVDAVAAAGGDLVRLHGISFTLQDPNAAQAKAREAAVKDAMDKAKQFASLTGVGLGKLVYITESGSYVPNAQYAKAMDVRAEGVATTIQPGTLDVSVYVQAVFAIQ